MKVNYIYSFLFAALFAIIRVLPGYAQAQQQPAATANLLEITGTVVSITDNTPMQGVAVRVEGVAGSFKETDAEGKFSINVPSYEVVLQVSYPGYKDFTFFAGTSALTVKMIPVGMKSNLEEVVLLNGVKRQQRFTSQAVKTLTEEHFTERPYVTMENYLYGKVAGVNVTSVNGMPGAASSVNIRGIGSVNASSQPLYIIDGMEISNVSYMTEWGSESFNTNLYNSPLITLNVNDIESVTFLKDAASKAIYGSRAGNGVVVIETAKGEKGNSKIDFIVNQGFDFKADQISMLNAEENRQYLLEMAYSQHQDAATVRGQFGQYLFNDPHSDYYQDYNNSTNWPDKVQNNAAYYGDYLFRIKGGDDVAKYSFSVGMFDKNGILKNTDMNKMSARFNLDYEVNEWMKIGTNLYFTKLSQARQVMGLSRYNPLLVAYQKTPLTTPFAKEPDGKVTPLYQDYDAFGISNPYALNQSTANEFKNNLMGGKIFAGFTFAGNYTASLSLGLHNQSSQDRLFLPQLGIAPLRDMFRISEQSYMSDLLFDGRADVNYQNKFGGIHYLNVGVGVNYLKDQMDYNFGRTFNSPGDDYTRLNQGKDTDKSASYDEQWKMIAGYLHANYILRDRYIADLSMRVDGSSRFGEDNRAAFYPALSLAWRLGEEDFMRTDWMDELKVRASVGYSGNDNVGNYTAKLMFMPANYKNLGGISLGQLANKDLIAERTLEYNLGLDVSVFNQHVNLSLDFYDRTNRNMVLPTVVALESGTPYAMMNSGRLNNRGIEVAVDGYFKTGDFNWNVGATFAYNKNKVTKMPEGTLSVISKYDEFAAMAVQGQPVGVYYGYQTNGVFATDAEAAQYTNGTGYEYDPFQGGDIRFVNQNGDVDPAGKEMIDQDDMVYLGKSMPDIVGGFHLQVSWKGFTLGGLIDAQLGREVVNGMRYKLESMKDYSNQTVATKNRWRQSGDITDMPRLSYDDPTGNSRFSDRWIEDGSFVRLRSLSLSYDFPTTWVQKIKLNKVRLFVNAENLLTYSNYLGFNPEFNHLFNDFISGIDAASVYVPRSVTFGIRIGL